MQEILDGVIKYRIDKIDYQLEMNDEISDMGKMKHIYSEQDAFEKMFSCLESKDLSSKILLEDLKDPYNPNVQLILLLVSMEPSLYFDLN